MKAVALALMLAGCASGVPKPPSSLPAGDPCEATAVGKFALECALTCKAREEDRPCYDACEAEIDRKCAQ